MSFTILTSKVCHFSFQSNGLSLLNRYTSLHNDTVMIQYLPFFKFMEVQKIFGYISYFQFMVWKCSEPVSTYFVNMTNLRTWPSFRFVILRTILFFNLQEASKPVQAHKAWSHKHRPPVLQTVVTAAIITSP